MQEQKCETQYMEKYEEQCSTVNEQVRFYLLLDFIQFTPSKNSLNQNLLF